ncbi:Kae1-associated serine/threonine protein kinase [Candidatus Woesearchaeota archaeon]|nr:Kae1-associated serine/threonine protein kinase [Candidatus Woesearchaeota archaeon]
MKQEISRGAEAVIYKLGSNIIKDRIKKSYRIPELDIKLRKSRTKRESKLLESLDFVPKIMDSNEKNMKITMEFINGSLIRDILDKVPKHERLKICKGIGKNLSMMHEKDVIHGDLTTSNMILKESKVYFIDFGLGFISRRVEDKAVDIHLLKQALEAKHNSHCQESFKEIVEGYKVNYPNYKEVLERLKKVESRGRYKAKIS